MLFIGIDGCPKGWIIARIEQQSVSFHQVKNLSDPIVSLQNAHTVLIDMPLGLLCTFRKGGRMCDQKARQLLPRHKKSSVFSAPTRSILSIDSYKECSAKLQEEGGGLSLQSFYILPKIRELDKFVANNPQIKILEAHPELAFQFLGLKDAPSKKSKEGRKQRIELLKNIISFIDWPPPQGLPQEDCLDALVLAIRASQNNLNKVDEAPVRDICGITMQIHY